jgi:hypothetical protein
MRHYIQDSLVVGGKALFLSRVESLLALKPNKRSAVMIILMCCVYWHRLIVACCGEAVDSSLHRTMMAVAQLVAPDSHWRQQNCLQYEIDFQ